VVVIHSFAGVSGGYFNPAVPTGVLARGSVIGDHRFGVVDWGVYFVAQIFGGWAASLTAWFLR